MSWALVACISTWLLLLHSPAKPSQSLQYTDIEQGPSQDQDPTPDLDPSQDQDPTQDQDPSKDQDPSQESEQTPVLGGDFVPWLAKEQTVHILMDFLFVRSSISMCDRWSGAGRGAGGACHGDRPARPCLAHPRHDCRQPATEHLQSGLGVPTQTGPTSGQPVPAAVRAAAAVSPHRTVQ